VTSAAPRTLALCADDFGIAAGVSRGIARLAHARRLTAVSCITTGAQWPEHAALLAGAPDSLDVGLHLNLTEGAPLSKRLARLWPRLPSLPKLIALAHMGRVPRAEMRAELHAQLSAFHAARGERPRFIDGHQHVHHLPGSRELMLDMLEHVQPLPALRNTGRVLGPGSGFKRWMIERTGGRALLAAAQRRMIPHNAALLGVYGFDDPDYRALMQRWLAALPPEGALLFCHPGDPDPAYAGDAIAAARRRERDYLASDAFSADLAAAGVVLGRVWQGDLAPAVSETSTPG